MMPDKLKLTIIWTCTWCQILKVFRIFFQILESNNDHKFWTLKITEINFHNAVLFDSVYSFIKHWLFLKRWSTRVSKNCSDTTAACFTPDMPSSIQHGTKYGNVSKVDKIWFSLVTLKWCNYALGYRSIKNESVS